MLEKISYKVHMKENSNYNLILIIEKSRESTKKKKNRV